MLELGDREVAPDELDLIREIDRVDGKHPSLEQLVAALSGSAVALDRAILKRHGQRKPPGAPCVTRHQARHYSGRRPLSVIDLQVIHDEEAPTALAAALWFTNLAAGGSATYCSDDYECYRSLSDAQIPWGAPGANYHGLHYEQAGFARWFSRDWGRHYYTIDRTAWKIARDARLYGIEVRWLDAHALGRGLRDGQTSHLQCSHAFGGTHRDPGFGYPKPLLMRRVRHHHEDLRHVKRIA